MDDIVTTIYKDISSTSTGQLDFLPTFFSKSTGYLRFVSDGTVHYTGFKLTFIAFSMPGG